MTIQAALSDYVNRKDYVSCRRDREIAEDELAIAIKTELRLLRETYGLDASWRKQDPKYPN